MYGKVASLMLHFFRYDFMAIGGTCKPRYRVGTDRFEYALDL